MNKRSFLFDPLINTPQVDANNDRVCITEIEERKDSFVLETITPGCKTQVMQLGLSRE